jgi:superfamily II DNA or RNA helicase
LSTSPLTTSSNRGTSASRRSYRKFIIESSVRNRALIAIARKARKPALLFVRNIKHGRWLEAALREAKLRTLFVWGKHSQDQRSFVLKQLVAGDLDVVVCNKIFVTGTDIPELAAVINGAGGASEIEVLQRLGRGTRITETKTTFELWDIADQGTRGNRWNTKHAKKRFVYYTGQKFPVLYKEDLVW